MTSKSSHGHADEEYRLCQKCAAPLAENERRSLCAKCLLESVIKLSSAGPERSASHRQSDWSPSLPEELRKMLPGYDITNILGKGGMAAVYKGTDKKLDRVVAIKVLPEIFLQADDDFNFLERFKQEALAMGKLDHPAIVSVYDFGETDQGQLYFVMEYVNGMDVHKYLKQEGGILPQEKTLSIITQVLDALEYAHGRGILHRDIKPANILLSQDCKVKVADFGLAKSFGNSMNELSIGLTSTNAAVGTPDFVAPESLMPGKKLDQRTDLYAVGVMLYRMLTGKMPRESFKMPSELYPELDVRLDIIVEKSTQSDPEHRYATASSMKADIDQIMRHPQSLGVVNKKKEYHGKKAYILTKQGTLRGAYYISVAMGVLLVAGGIASYIKSGKKAPPNSSETQKPQISKLFAKADIGSPEKTRPLKNEGEYVQSSVTDEVPIKNAKLYTGQPSENNCFALIASLNSNAIASMNLGTGEVKIIHKFKERSSPRGIAVLQSGVIYVSLRLGGKNVIRMTPEKGGGFEIGDICEKIGPFGAGKLRITDKGDLLVSGDVTGSLLRFDLKSGKPKPSVGLVDMGNVLGFDTLGDEIYAVEVFGGRIARFELKENDALADWLVNDPDATMKRATGITIGHNENLFITNTESSAILEYSRESGEYLGVLYDVKENGAHMSNGIRYIPALKGYIVSSDGNLLRLDLDGKLVREYSLAPVIDGATSFVVVDKEQLSPILAKKL